MGKRAAVGKSAAQKIKKQLYYRKVKRVSAAASRKHQQAMRAAAQNASRLSKAKTLVGQLAGKAKSKLGWLLGTASNHQIIAGNVFKKVITGMYKELPDGFGEPLRDLKNQAYQGLDIAPSRRVDDHQKNYYKKPTPRAVPMFNADGTKNWSMNRMISEGEAAKNVGAIFGGTGSKNYSIIGQAPCRGKQSNYQFPNILEVDNAWTMIKFWDGVQRYSSTHRHHVYGPMSKQYIEKRAQFPCSDVRSRNPRACCVMLKGVHSLNGRQLGLPFVKNKIPAACEKSFGIYNLNSDSCKSAVAKSRELGVSTNRKKDLIELYAEAETTAHAFGQSNAKLCGAWSNHPENETPEDSRRLVDVEIGG